MERMELGTKGPEFSRIVVGAWRWQALSFIELSTLIKSSIDIGMTTFDHADIYGDYSCEEIFGNCLKRDPSLRSNIQLISKCGIKLLSDKRASHKIKHYDTSRKHIVDSVDNSLKNLSTDYLDLLLIHRPDPLMNPSEVAETFDELKKSGKVLHFGVSNFTSTQFEMLNSHVTTPLTTNQIELSLFYNNALFDGTVDTLMKHRVSPMAWSPLGGGEYIKNNAFTHGIESEISQMCDRYELASFSQLLLVWLLNHPSKILPVVGTSKPDRLIEASKAVPIKLEHQDWFTMLKWATRKDVA